VGLDPNGLRLKELARIRPRLAALVLYLAMGIPARFAVGILRRQVFSSLPLIDGAALGEGERFARFAQVLAIAFRQGGRAPAREMGLMISRWDFPLKRCRFPVTVFQGEADSFGARPAMARALGTALGADVRILPEGHISIFTNRLDDILASLSGP
jgi:hypothetical protein